MNYRHSMVISMKLRNRQVNILNYNYVELQKRQQDECDMHYRLELLLCRHVLSAIASLC